MQKISPLIYHPEVVNAPSKVCLGIIDREHRITSYSHYSAELVGFKHPNDLCGMTKLDYRGAAAEAGSEFYRQDMRVMNTKEDLDLLTVFVSAEENLHFLITKKQAVLSPESGAVIGCEAISYELEKQNFTPFTERLFKHLTYSRKAKRVFGSTIVDSYKDLGLTSRESEVLFLLTYGQSAKQIAAEIFLSPRTVESHINSLKAKLDVPNKSGLIEYALFAGLNSQLPRKLLRKLF